MSVRFQELVAQNLRRPRGIVGSLVSRLVFDKVNVYLEQNAARLCQIQPHHKVLEVGFACGHGLKEASKYVKDGPGIIYGLEYSELMLKTASRRLKSEIQNRKVDLSYGTVLQLPYNTDMFDSVFHCNCYYFWPNMKVAIQELHRVMKPGSTMVTTMNLERVRRAKERGYLKYGHADPVQFMWALEEYGFEDVNFEYMSEGGKKFEVIFARINEKAAYDEEFEEEVATLPDLHGDKGKTSDSGQASDKNKLNSRSNPRSTDKVTRHTEPSIS